MIGEQVTRAHREIPAVTFVEECDFTGLDVSLLVAHAIRAVAAAVVRFPELNARLEDDEIVLLDRVDVGVAVQTDDGLVVPVVRGCSGRSVEELDADVRRLAEGARAGSLGVEELRDSTITITSAGKLGGLLVTPLVNYPEVAIVGLHRIVERPVVRDGQIVDPLDRERLRHVRPPRRRRSPCRCVLPRRDRAAAIRLGRRARRTGRTRESKEG